MNVIADFHIHSRYSRACSKELLLPNIARWCEIKGINVVGTGDFTFPAWISDIQRQLEEVGDGIFQLADKSSKTQFVLTTELSSIYKQGDQVRRIHLCVLMPSVKAVKKLITLLEDRGVNLKSDGRPILGLSAIEVTKLALEADERALVIPAHAWTPWFAVFGSKSGFDSLDECFGDMTKHIYAIETGLSSDPQMNWRWSHLDNIMLVSNSDAHSLRKLGREANVFSVDNFDYQTLHDILRTRDTKRFIHTIEFFPEEGKYHHDGHRDCGVMLKPSQTKKQNGICPKCKKSLTVGVLYRIDSLADRPEDYQPKGRVPFKSIVPLEEVIAEAVGRNPGTKTVNTIYAKLTEEVGAEFPILLDIPYKEIAKAASPVVVEAIRRVREGKVQIEPGYDGVFGKVSLFSPKEREKRTQAALL
jgi:uncharacterized protein (TIGR00375 family)